MTTKISAEQYQRNIERDEAIARLRELAPKGSTIYGLVRHVSSSGMYRRISFYVVKDNRPVWLDALIARLGTYKQAARAEGLAVSGCGMDMIFSVVYDSARVVFDGDGYAWKHESL